ncbi:MAG TPA: hypothetical protein ENK83_05060 [Aliiroseovarius sp.]|nr:hypothetical protein [Aliiroseovarius sp.]
MLLSIDIAECPNTDGIYIALLCALGAPDRHGRNLDALWDSISSDINSVAPPYSIKALGTSGAPDGALKSSHATKTLSDRQSGPRSVNVSISHPPIRA